jgi:hypothetical protein
MQANILTIQNYSREQNKTNIKVLEIEFKTQQQQVYKGEIKLNS